MTRVWLTLRSVWDLLSPATQWTLIGLLYLVLGVIIWRSFAP